MKLVLGVVRSIKYGALGALVFTLLLCNTTWAGRWCPPGLLNTDSSCIDYNPRANFDVPILSGGHVTSTHVDQSFSLILANGYGDIYFLNMLRDRNNYQAYRGYCRYRGFSLSGCSTTGEVVLMRMKPTPVMPEHFPWSRPRCAGAQTFTF
jgi:hypothetical protein